ncbi:carboxymuconolactone decarboxylase family protein [Caenispirillum bisanense]|uniref:carboxymuconolactone decarboxylase family protein n=1 Tax=Caenispirillum bisanense TaxID=414052 RepID=UPI0031E05E20
MTDERFTRGLDRLRQLHGVVGDDFLDDLRAVAPDFARMVVEFPYGDLHSRPGLPARDRQIAIVSALAAMGNAPKELKIHIRAALNAGVTREELVEVLMQLAPYAGFPAALEGLFAAKEVFAAADAAASTVVQED